MKTDEWFLTLMFGLAFLGLIIAGKEIDKLKRRVEELEQKKNER